VPDGHRAGPLGHRPVGRVWGHDNVRIVDGSVHVTNGGVNPVLTILAGALRIATDMTRGMPVPQR
jgi:choline dehydrogenase-like flavoprotein